MIYLERRNHSAREIIQNCFSPFVGVITSSFADELCRKNNLSFVELLQPFSKLQNETHFRDLSGTSISIKGLRLNVCDVNWRPPQTMLARKMLNEAVANTAGDENIFVNIGSTELKIPYAGQWFEKWRETFLTVQFPSDHEFTRHFLSCLLVLSSTDPNIIETADKLTQQAHFLQNIAPQKFPKWFQTNDVLNSYIVLHEGSSGDISKAQHSYELLKSAFGNNNCFLIQINSVMDGTMNDMPDYWDPFIKKPKSDSLLDQNNGPKTPQDSVSVISMPSMQISFIMDVPDNDINFLHPLSPVQEQATEAIHSKFSVSSESIPSQMINANVLAAHMDSDTPHGTLLNAMDVENLRHFVQDYAIRALIPYVERISGVLNDTITNKKGVSKSLLSATKRWFVTSKPGAGTSNQNAVIYTHESAELQTRKLGDLYFMFGHYNLAFQAYHQAKRDFNADSAWQYYAGALEMAAVSAFMLGTPNRKTYDYMEDAIVCYLTVCKLQQFATRATLLSVECLKTAQLYGEAAKQLIRMTSEESDLRSALLLEQASYCFLASQPPMHRKYAFHIVLSGNRFSRAGQRKHALRCYRQAYQVFGDKGWSLAEDHIQYTIAKQAYSLKKLEEASKSFAHLLRPTSMQNIQQQIAFLKEYIQTQKELIKRDPGVGLSEIALPRVVQSSIRVLITAYTPLINPLYVAASNIHIDSNLVDEPIWHRIEEMIVMTVNFNKPMLYKPSQSLFTSENATTESPFGVQGEPIEIAVKILNTIKCNITMTDIDLLWKLKLENKNVLSNISLYENDESRENDNEAIRAAIKTTCSQQIVLEECEKKNIFFKITPKLTGLLNIIGIVGRVALTSEINESLIGCLYFEAQKLKSAGKKSTNTTLKDNKLSIRILPPAPALGVSFTPISNSLLVGEIVPVMISLRNSGILPIDEVYIGIDCPRWVTVIDNEIKIPLSILREYKNLKNLKLVKDKEIRSQHVVRILKYSNKPSLKAQEAATVPIWIQAPYQKGEFKLRLLFYYSMPCNYISGIKYRLVRHEWTFNIHECLHVEAKCVVSNFVSNDWGLDIEFKNLNQMHHQLTTEIYINSADLFCSRYKLDEDKLFYMNKIEVSAGQLGDKCLKSAKSVSIQCRLQEATSEKNSNIPDSEKAHYIINALSSLPIMLRQAIKENHIPPFNKLYSFLMKNETKFLSSNTSSEEFNNFINTSDPHMTIIFTWTAVVVEDSVQRISYGQHFLQLRNLYEQATCPVTFDYGIYRESLSIHHVLHFNNRNGSVLSKGDVLYTTDDEHWEDNNNFVGKRCLLEDEF